LPQIESDRERKIAEARSYKFRAIKVAEAESERFMQQLQAYLVMPTLYKLRTYLSLLEKEGSSIRKFIVSATLSHEVYELNFEQKSPLKAGFTVFLLMSRLLETHKRVTQSRY